MSAAQTSTVSEHTLSLEFDFKETIGIRALILWQWLAGRYTSPRLLHPRSDGARQVAGEVGQDIVAARSWYNR
jgi:hypothetical protein